MNPRSVIQGLLLLIFTLAAALLYLLTRPLPRSAPVPEAITQTNVVTRIAVRKFNSTNYFVLPSSFNWSQLETTNYVAYIENLRAIGCPDDTIHDIVIADIARLYHERRLQWADRVTKEGTTFWQTDPAYDAGRIERRQKRRELFLEERALVRQLLGVDLEAEVSKFQREETAPSLDLDFLAGEKQAKVREIAEKYDLLKAGVHDTPLLLPQDRVRLRALEAEQEKELRGLLSDTELEDFELRNSALAGTLRSDLNGFEPSEQEFRKIFQVRKEYEEALAKAAGNGSTPDEEQQALVDQALDEELKQQLGDERYQKYVQTQDPSFQLLSGLSQRFGMESSKVQEAYDRLRTASQHQQEVLNSTTLEPEQMERALQEMSRETERELQRILGADIFQQFRGAGGRTWMDLATPPGGGRR